MAYVVAMRLTLNSVNVGRSKKIGERDGKPVRSAIRKAPVLLPTIEVGPESLAGDTVADRRVHGGPDKAVYAYPTDNWDWWTEKGLACAPGAFGENLTVTGADETAVRIGDRFRWGPVLFEVSQPRAPCSKFQLFSGREDASALMTISGRCGWYLRVIETGEADVTAPLERETEGSGATAREAFHAAFNRRLDPSVRAGIASHPALADAWKRMLR